MIFVIHICISVLIIYVDMGLESTLLAVAQMFERWMYCTAVIIATNSLLASTIN